MKNAAHSKKLACQTSYENVKDLHHHTPTHLFNPSLDVKQVTFQKSA